MIKFGLAQLGAMQVWRNAQADQASAVRAFKAALASGNTRLLPELYEAAGARLPFERSVVSEVARFVASYLDGRLD